MKLFAVVFAVALIRAQAADLGAFMHATDIGDCGRAGSVKVDPAAKSYIVTGGGANMWFTNDAFHFVWTRLSGDISLAADIEIAASDGDPHRKGVLMIRQSLDADSAYADAALHGDGLTSLQYRETKGARTYEIQANRKAPSGCASRSEGSMFRCPSLAKAKS